MVLVVSAIVMARAWSRDTVERPLYVTSGVFFVPALPPFHFSPLSLYSPLHSFLFFLFPSTVVFPSFYSPELSPFHSLHATPLSLHCILIISRILLFLFLSPNPTTNTIHVETNTRVTLL